MIRPMSSGLRVRSNNVTDSDQRAVLGSAGHKARAIFSTVADAQKSAAKMDSTSYKKGAGLAAFAECRRDAEDSQAAQYYSIPSTAKMDSTSSKKVRARRSAMVAADCLDDDRCGLKQQPISEVGNGGSALSQPLSALSTLDASSSFCSACTWV